VAGEVVGTVVVVVVLDPKEEEEEEEEEVEGGAAAEVDVDVVVGVGVGVGFGEKRLRREIGGSEGRGKSPVKGSPVMKGWSKSSCGIQR
jgi:hypothetical protein